MIRPEVANLPDPDPDQIECREQQWEVQKCVKMLGMNQSARTNPTRVLILPCDGDPAIRPGDWLRLWNSIGGGIAHDVWVGVGGIAYENSGPGGGVRRNYLANVLAGRHVIHIVTRTAPVDLTTKHRFAEERVGTPWAAFYNCQDFASEVAIGKPQSFQREGVLVVSALLGGILLWANNQRVSPQRRPSRRRR